MSWWNPYAEPALELGTRLSAAECREKLARRVAPWYQLWPTEQRPLRGRVGPAGFRFHRFRGHRHGFETQARGRFEPDSTGTRVRVRFGLRFWDHAIFVLWPALTVVAAIRFQQAAAGGTSWVSRFPIGFAVVMNLFFIALFLSLRWSNRDDLAFLTSLIEDELKATPSPAGAPIE